MSEATTDTGPSIEELTAQVFGEDKPAEAAVEAPPASEPKPESKDPNSERVAARILANQKAELRAVKLRQEQAAREETLTKREAEVAEMAKTAEALKAAKLSPSKALELLGMTPKEFLESLATENEPDAIAQRAVQGTLSEVQKLQARIDAMEAADRERQQRARVQADEAGMQAASQGFIDFVADNADKYPTLIDEMTPDEIVSAGVAALAEVLGKDSSGKTVTRLQAYVAEHGKPPGDDEIAEMLEERAKPRAQARTEWRTRLGKNTPTATAAKATADVRETQLDRGPSPRTLTSRAATEKASTPTKWSQEQADAESLRILQDALRG